MILSISTYFKWNTFVLSTQISKIFCIGNPNNLGIKYNMNLFWLFNICFTIYSLNKCIAYSYKIFIYFFLQILHNTATHYNGIRILIIWTLLCIWYNPWIWQLTFVLMVVLRGSSSIPTRSMTELFVKALKDSHKELLDMVNFLDLHLYLKNYNFSFPCTLFVVWDNKLFLQFVLDKMKGSTIKLSTERRKADKKMTRSKTWKSRKPQKSPEKQLNKVTALSTNTK